MKLSPIVLLARNLSPQQHKDICLDLVKKITGEDSSQNDLESYISTFCELIGIAPALKQDIHPILSKFCIKLLNDCNECNYDTIVKLSENFDKIPIDLIRFIVTKLRAYAASNQRSFDDSLFKLIDLKGILEASENEISLPEVQSLLKFLECYFVSADNNSSSLFDTKLDKLCYLYLGIDDRYISQLCLRILRWRMDSICQSKETIDFLWKAISDLMVSGVDFKISSGFTLWMRFFNRVGTDELFKDEEFQKVISKEGYWLFLRDGLISEVHEHKKFSLTLIQMSVKSLSSDIDSSMIKWDVSKRDENLESWKRFCTLYEILGIDTAMNQAEAASNDMVRILSSTSAIPVPFALTILAVGFKASLSSVRKFTMSMVFSLPKESLGLFKYDFKFLTSIFLPFTLSASHFSTKKSIDGKYTCEFGEKLTLFVKNCVDSLGDLNDVSIFVEQILQMLVDNKLAFDPARIYVTNGIFQALDKKNRDVLDFRHLNLLYVLFECKAEGDIFYQTMHAINLKLLLHINTRVVNIRTVFESIATFVQHIGYGIYIDNEEFFIDFININFAKDEVIELFNIKSSEMRIETFILVLSNLIQSKHSLPAVVPKILTYPQVEQLLIEIINSGLQFSDLILEPMIVSRLQRLIVNMFEGSKELHDSVYSKSDKLISNKVLFNEEFWMSVDLLQLFGVVSEDLQVSENEVNLRYAVAQSKFLANCTSKCIYNENFGLNIQNVSGLLMKAFDKQPKGGDKNFYKVKDQFYGSILNIVEQLLNITPMSTDLKEQILETSESLVSHSAYHCHLANVELLDGLIMAENSGKNIVVADANVILDILSAIWEELISDRLILSQKDLHHKFIALLMHKSILKLSASDDEIAEKIFKIADNIIEKSFARKSLLPKLFKTISDYQVTDNESFEKTLWLGKLLVKGNYFLQISHNLFKLDMVISDLFDKSLNMTGVSLYTQCYGDHEISYRVLVNIVTASIKNPEFATRIWEYILNNEKVFNFLCPLKRTDANEQWQRMQLSVTMLTCLRVLPKESMINYMDKIILPRLVKESSPLCRMYLEWMVAYCIYTHPESRNLLFSQFDEDIDQQLPVSLTVFERISFLVAQQLNKKDEANFLENFIIKVLLPSATTNRALTRHFSVSVICSVYPEIIKKDLKLSPELIATLETVYTVASKAEGFAEHRTGDAMMWNIVKDFNLVGINGGVLLKISDREIDAIMEKTWLKYVTEEQLEISNIPIGHDQQSDWIQKKRSAEVKIETYYGSYDDTASSLLQTKSGAWSTVMEVDSNSRAASSIKRSPLIVVGSLVDKAPNLGGICRLCDVLGAGWLTVGDLAVQNDTEFKAVAVTADRWMPMLQVQIAEISEFMRLKKKEGYTLIGLEQTDNSVELNGDLKFPKKSLILLGKEREGIPGDLLAELDMCVIIKQVGVIRSMNIQTATAVIVHAYSSQHC